MFAVPVRNDAHKSIYDGLFLCHFTSRSSIYKASMFNFNLLIQVNLASFKNQLLYLTFWINLWDMAGQSSYGYPFLFQHPKGMKTLWAI